MLYLHDILREAASRRGRIAVSGPTKTEATKDYTDAWDCFNRYLTAYFMKFRGVNLSSFLRLGWIHDMNGYKPFFCLADSFVAAHSLESGGLRVCQTDLKLFSDFNWIKASMKFSHDLSKENFKTILNDIVNLIGEHARLNHSMSLDFEVGKLLFQDRKARFIFSNRVLQHPSLNQTALENHINVASSVLSGSGKSLFYNPSSNFEIPDDAVSVLSRQGSILSVNRRPKSEGTRLFAAGNVSHPVFNPIEEEKGGLNEGDLEKLKNDGNESMLNRFLKESSNVQKSTFSCCGGMTPEEYEEQINMREAERESPFLLSEIKRLRNEAASADVQSSEIRERLQQLAASAENLLRKKHGDKKRNSSNSTSGEMLSALGEFRDPNGALPGFNHVQEDFKGNKSANEEALDRYLTYLEVRAAQALREREMFERGVQRGLDEEREEQRLKAAMTKQYREYLDSQINHDKERQAVERNNHIIAASTHEFPLMSECAPDVLKKQTVERGRNLRKELDNQINLNRVLREREKAVAKLHEAQVSALSQTESSNRYRQELMQKQQEKIELIEAWERDLRMKNILKSIEKHIDHPQLAPLDLGNIVNHPPSCAASQNQPEIIAGSLHDPVGPVTQQMLMERHVANMSNFQKSLKRINSTSPPLQFYNPRPSSNVSLRTSSSCAQLPTFKEDENRRHRSHEAQQISLPAVNKGTQNSKNNFSSMSTDLPQMLKSLNNRPKTSCSVASLATSTSGARLVPGGASVSLQKQRELLKKSRSSGFL